MLSPDKARIDKVHGPFRANDWRGRFAKARGQIVATNMEWGFICLMTDGNWRHYMLKYDFLKNRFFAVRSEGQRLEHRRRAELGCSLFPATEMPGPDKPPTDGYEGPINKTLQRFLTTEDKAAIMSQRMAAGARV